MADMRAHILGGLLTLALSVASVHGQEGSPTPASKTPASPTMAPAPASPPPPPPPTVGVKPVAAPPAEMTIPMELMRNRPVVRATINGQGPFALLVAPEAQATVIDQSLIVEPKDKKSEAHRGPHEVEIDFGTVKLSSVKVQTVAMATLFPDVGPAARPRGVLTAQVWPGKLITLDYLKYQVLIGPGTLDDMDPREVFASSDKSIGVGMPVSVAGRSLTCRLDPTFTGGLLLPDSYSQTLFLLNKPITTGSIIIAASKLRLIGSSGP